VSVTADRRDACRLTARLWARARAHHEENRGSRFVTALRRRRLPWRAYADWLAQLYFLHEALAQAEAVMFGEPVGAALARSTHVCLPALAADLEFLHGGHWQRRIAAYPATTMYCTDVRDAAVRSPQGFAAALYARNVEDLLAATDTGPAASTAYGLDDAGCRFLTPRDTDWARYLDRCPAVLDHAPWPAGNDEIVADVTRAHRSYTAVIDQLDRRCT
jgi:heme oxygenase